MSATDTTESLYDRAEQLRHTMLRIGLSSGAERLSAYVGALLAGERSQPAHLHFNDLADLCGQDYAKGSSLSLLETLILDLALRLARLGFFTDRAALQAIMNAISADVDATRDTAEDDLRAKGAGAILQNTPIIYDPKFVLDPDILSDMLWADLSWERRDGTPRCEYYCNDIPDPYTYGRGAGERTYQPQPWHPAITTIRSKLEAQTNTIFETCFLNGYLDQSDQLGWHADNSPEMDDDRPIAIVSLGAEREIWLRPQGDKSAVQKLKLQNGSLCLMMPGMQDTHFHRIPKAGFVCGKRISLTFRGYKKP